MHGRAVFQDSRQWCFLTLKPGTDPLKALVESFLDTWQFAATDPERVKRQHGWIELLQDGKATLSDLIDATERRRKELDQPKPPAFFLYVDQGEELYVRAEERQRRRFSELLAQALPDPRLRTMMSMRSDFLGSLQNDEPLFKARQLDRRAAAARGGAARGGQPPGAIARGAVRDRGARRHHQPRAPRRIRSRTWAPCRSCPTRSTTCGRRWCRRDDGRCAFRRNPSSLAACWSTAPTRFWRRIRAPKHALRRVLTLRLATVREDGEPTRRRAVSRGVLGRGVAARLRAGRLSQSASRHRDHRDGRDLCRGGARGDFPALGQAARMDRRRARVPRLAQRPRSRAPRLAGDGGRLEERRPAHGRRADAGAKLAGKARGGFAHAVDREFIALSIARERKAQARARRVQALVYVLLIGVIAGLVAWINQLYIGEQVKYVWTERPFAAANIWPYVLKPAAEQALKADRAKVSGNARSSSRTRIIAPTWSWSRLDRS